MEPHSLASWNTEDPLREESWQDAEEKQGWFPKMRQWPYVVSATVSDQESRPLIPAPDSPTALGQLLFFLPSHVLFSGLGVLSCEIKGGTSSFFRGPHNYGHEWVNEQSCSESGLQPECFSPAGNPASSGVGSRSC